MFANISDCIISLHQPLVVPGRKNGLLLSNPQLYGIKLFVELCDFNLHADHTRAEHTYVQIKAFNIGHRETLDKIPIVVSFCVMYHKMFTLKEKVQAIVSDGGSKHWKFLSNNMLHYIILVGCESKPALIACASFKLAKITASVWNSNFLWQMIRKLLEYKLLLTSLNIFFFSILENKTGPCCWRGRWDWRRTLSLAHPYDLPGVCSASYIGGGGQALQLLW